MKHNTSLQFVSYFSDRDIYETTLSFSDTDNYRISKLLEKAGICELNKNEKSFLQDNNFIV